MSKSAIEWTEQTWNPIVGCSIVSPGCSNCYAMKTAARNEAMGISRYDGTTREVNGNVVWTGKLAQAPESTLLQPLKRKKPTTYFVNSMGDLFHEDVPDAWIDRVFAVMALTPQHTYQVLTKRATRMKTYFIGTEGYRDVHPLEDRVSSIADAGGRLMEDGDNAHDYLLNATWPLPNVWLGVSTERQQEADERIPLLLQTPAAVRFISAEPLLGPIDPTRICILPQKPGSVRAGIHIDALRGRYCESGVTYKGNWDITGPPPPDSERRRLDWVIVGGESGPGARPMHPDWARSLRDRCDAAGVPFFFKQWGEWAPSTPDQAKGNPRSGWQTIKAHPHVARAEELYPEAVAAFVERVGKARAGRLLDGVEYNAMPEVSA